MVFLDPSGQEGKGKSLRSPILCANRVEGGCFGGRPSLVDGLSQPGRRLPPGDVLNEIVERIAVSRGARDGNGDIDSKLDAVRQSDDCTPKP